MKTLMLTSLFFTLSFVVFVATAPTETTEATSPISLRPTKANGFSKCKTDCNNQYQTDVNACVALMFRLPFCEKEQSPIVTNVSLDAHK
ncbi:hypothetical protein LSAT2_031361 [Lamellibrachia satsuma]|nr:hypothetical protein LSAT2_031361 [Lamellibrachia satsuma]